MRIVVVFNGGGLTIDFEDLITITDDGDHLILHGGDINIVVNASVIAITSMVVIRKTWLLNADKVYLDTRIEKEE